jgi:CRP-like cAMP-binding protein
MQPTRTLTAEEPLRSYGALTADTPQTTVPSTPDIAALTSRLLEGLAPQDRTIVLAAAKERRYPARAVTYVQETPATELFLLTRGRARYFFMTPEGQKLLLMWLTPGDIFGGKALLSVPSSYVLTVETVRESRVLVWDRSTIRSLAVRYPRILENALSLASDYLDWYLADHVALTCHNARQRLAEVLVCLARGIGHAVPGGVELDVTNEELGSAANVTPYTASRLISRWERNHALVKSRGKLLLRAPQRLFAAD